MPDRPTFEPLFPAHAIERCAVTVVFRENLPEKTFSRAVAGASSAFSKKGLKPAESPPAAFSIDMASGKVGPPVGAQPRMFALPDGSANLLVGPNLITWQNTRYVTWSPFIGQFRDLAIPAISEFLENVSLASVRLEYWDRFNWTGTWDDFDAKQLIRIDAANVLRDWSRWRRQWHSHAGWFEQVGSLRRLSNVNVDIGEWAGVRPSVLIYTMMQDETNIPGYGESDPTSLNQDFVFERLETIHRDLKALLGTVITDSMAARISLNKEATS